MSFGRKMRRSKQKELKKQARKEAKKIEKAISKMPTHCGECNTPFDRSIDAALDSWKIAVYDDGPIHLVCPACVPLEYR